MVGERPTIVVKYGGSSLAEPKDFHAVAAHQRGLYESGLLPVAVNSARKGASDRLLGVWRGNARLADYIGDESAFYADGVFAGRPDRDPFMEDLRGHFAKVRQVMEAGSGQYPDTHRESILLADGEAEAGLALQHLMRDFMPGLRFMDGREAGVVAKSMRGPVDIKASVRNIREGKGDGDVSYGGFVGRDPANPEHSMLLDRNSTDLTAALVAAALRAREYRNVKDVDGVMICDPRVCDGDGPPRIIEMLSYAEAADITRGGSPVIHPAALIVSEGYGVRIRITSLGNKGGTLISAASGTTLEKPYAAISSLHAVCATVEDKAMDIPNQGRGYAADVMRILADSGYDILNITGPGTAMSVVVAGGSEVSKGKGADVGEVCSALTQGLRQRDRDGTVRAREIGYISITGAAMRGRPGTWRQIADVISGEGINLSMVGQGDEAFIETPVVSFCVDTRDYGRAVNALRKKLF